MTQPKGEILWKNVWLNSRDFAVRQIEASLAAFLAIKLGEIVGNPHLNDSAVALYAIGIGTLFNGLATLTDRSARRPVRQDNSDHSSSLKNSGIIF